MIPRPFASFDDLEWLAAGVTTRASEIAFLDTAGGRLRAVAAVRQVHGAGVIHVVGPPDQDPGGNARLPGDPRDEAARAAGRDVVPVAWPLHPRVAAWRFSAADALATALPGVVIAVSVADCLPAIVVDPEHRVIGVAHAGWRGLAAGAISALVNEMRRDFGTHAETCRVGLGPAIGPCCYTVGEDVAQAMREGGRDAAFSTEAAHPSRVFRLDLWKTAERELVALGVRPRAIQTIRECTACHSERYFSRRRDGAILGRMWGYAAILG